VLNNITPLTTSARFDESRAKTADRRDISRLESLYLNQGGPGLLRMSRRMSFLRGVVVNFDAQRLQEFQILLADLEFGIAGQGGY